MENQLCQSCRMPLNEPEVRGTCSNQEKSGDYCCYCYKEGNFTHDYIMEEMINHCALFVEDFNKDSEIKYSKEEAIAQMKTFFPTLKRWSKN